MPTLSKTVSRLFSTTRRALFASTALIAGLSMSAPVSATAVGYIAGELDVGGGSAGYSVPIAVPPGVAGMEPLLSINYSSQSGNGLLGIGWNLSGISLVHRCGSTLAQDGRNRQVKLDSSDNYCVDGKRLIPVNGANGADGTEYRTEVEGFSKVISYGSAGNGPAWFKVWTKSGQVMEFGNTADSRIEAQGKSTVLNYAVNKISDTSLAGNSINFHYNEINANSEFVPTHISYGPNGQNKVEFTYSEVTDLPSSKLEGSKIKTSKRLSKIETFANAEAVQNWTFTFEAQTDRPDKLTAIKLCAADGTCLPETTVGWDKFKPITNIKTDPYVIDFNGDGIEDSYRLASASSTTVNLYVTYQNVAGNAFEKKVLSNIPKFRQQEAYPGGEGDTYPVYYHPTVNLGDFNGDGLTDIDFSYDKTQLMGVFNLRWNRYLSNGQSFIFNRIHNYLNYTHPAKIAGNDFNGDGINDVLTYPSSSGGNEAVRVALGKKDGSYDLQRSDIPATNWYMNDLLPRIVCVNGSIDSSGNEACSTLPVAFQILDINNDGYSDVKYNGAFVLGTQEGFSYFTRVSSYTGNAKTQLDMVTSITNNTTTTLEYASILDSSVYPNQSESYSYPEKELRGTYLVKSVTSDNGVGGTRKATYQYGGAKVNQIGRGYLGFAWTEETDESTGTKVRTEYNQSFPYIGMVAKSETFLADGTLINQSSSHYAHHTSFDEKIYFPYVTTSTEKSYERDGSLITTITTENDQFDDYGNLGWVKVTTTGAGETYSKTTTNTFDNDAAKWHLGRLRTATVVHEHADGSTKTRHSAFEYDPITGFLNKEIVEPGTTMEVATTTTYDDHGNKIAVSTLAYGESTPRSASTAFDSNGQFPVSSTNALGHSDSKVTDARYGVLTSQTGPNSLTTTWEYDGFGNRVKETRADGTVSTVNRYWVESGECAHAPARTSYCVISQTDGSAPAEVYYDSLNRKLRTVTLGFNAQPVYKDTVYNSLGQVAKVSRAYYADALQTYWATSTYDDMGRLIQAEEPGVNGISNLTSTSYNGLTTIATNPAGQSKSTVTNALGKVISVHEPEGASMSYQYDALGNLIKTTDSAGNIVTIEYDLLGRKIGMNDPDMGIWSYDYNGYGELIEQTDAKGQSSQMQYDVLGRMTQRSEPEGVSTWEYDTAANGIGKLAQVTGADGYQKTYTYDSLGRLLDATTEADNKVLTISTEYDQYSRLKKLVRPQGFVTENQYTAEGYLKAVRGLRGQASDYQVSHLETLLSTAITDAQSLQAEAATLLQQADYFYTAAADYAQDANQAVPYPYALEVYDPALHDDLYWQSLQTNVEFAYYRSGEMYQVFEDVNSNTFIKVSQPEGGAIDYVQLWFSVDGLSLTKAWNTAGDSSSFQAWMPDDSLITVLPEELIPSERFILAAPSNRGEGLIDLTVLPALDTALETALAAAANNGSADVLLNAVPAYEQLQQLKLPYQHPYPSYSAAYDPTGSADPQQISYYWENLFSTASQSFAFYRPDTDYPVYRDNSGNFFIKVLVPSAYRKPSEGIISLVKLLHEPGEYAITGLQRANYSQTQGHFYPLALFNYYVNPGSLISTDLTLSTVSSAEGDNKIDFYVYNSVQGGSLESLVVASDQLKAEAAQLTEDAAELVNAAELLLDVAETAYREALLAGYWAPGSDDEYYNDYQSLVQDDQYVYFWQAKERDAEGRLARELHGNGLSTVYNYDPSNGLLLQQQTGFASFDKLRDLNYQYDQLNNVTQRADLITEVEESFTYDNLDRLKSSTVVSTAAGENLTETKTYAYDVLGNITHKSDLGDYSYSSVRPHAVTSAGGSTYAYDDNGNMISGAGRTITWSSFNKPISMAKDGKYVDFAYAPDRARYLKTGSDGTKTLYLDKLYELITKGQEVTHKQFIYAGSSLVAVHVSGLDHNGSAIPVQTRYMHKDNLGSVDTITDGTGTVVDRMSFDPFGSRRQSNWREATVGINLIPVLTNRGFTGHEHIDEMDLIHMNGRVYDPTLGRFLSADPHIQSPYSTQSYNRYSYVQNNPLKYADPSGYFLGGLFDAIGDIFSGIVNAVKSILDVPIIRMAVGIAAAYFVGTWALEFGFSPMTAGAFGGFAGGVVSSGSIEGGIKGAITGAMFGYVGDQAYSELWQKALAHGAVGGISSKLQGGKFVHGFISASVAAYGRSMDWFKKVKAGVSKHIVSGVIGGTAAVLGGGKFSNGAVTAGFASALNDGLHPEEAESNQIKLPALPRASDDNFGGFFWNRLLGGGVRDDIYAYFDGFKDGTISVGKGLVNFANQAARTGSYNANLESQALDAAVDVYMNNSAVRSQANQALYVEAANLQNYSSYNIGRVVGRFITGTITRPASIIAGVGDGGAALEQGRNYATGFIYGSD
jgi:RHS repeat-associated protein